MSRADVETLIAQGRSIVIVDQYVMKLDAWIPYHPGGRKSIMHMVGKDATDEVNGYHSLETCRTMDRYRIGRIEGIWKNFLPPIQGGVFREHSACDKQKTETAGTTGPTVAGSSGRSSPRSMSPSPIFDENDVDGDTTQAKTTAKAENAMDASTDPTVIHRRVHGAQRAGSPYTSSSEEDEAEAGKDKANQRGKSGTDKPPIVATSFLDAKTREEISLDLDRYPSLDGETQRNVVLKYRELHEKIKAEGLYTCRYSSYVREISRYSLLFALTIIFLRMKWFALSAFFLGFFWHQLVFAAHDAGHMGITHDFQIDTCIGIFIADFLGGLSICWWKDNHNVHHIVTNSPEHDPDIEHMPLFAVSHRFLHSLRSSYYERIMEYDAAAKFFLSFQSWAYYPILCFGRFNLYRLSWTYIIKGQGPRQGPARWHRWLEAVGQVFFWVWFGYGVLYRSIDTNWDRFVYVMVSHIVTMPLHVQITLSHFAMSTADLGPTESFPQRQLRTTMDVDCPQWLDFFHGGLQFQAIHHLYPRMPRHNLRRAQKLVQQFCNEVGIPYALYGFVDGNKEVIGRLADVSRQAAILAQCQRAVAEGRA